MKRKRLHYKIYFILIIILNILSFVSYANVNVTNLQEVEDLIKKGEITEKHYLNDFRIVAENAQNPKSVQSYLEGVWFAHIHEFERAEDHFYDVLDSLESSPDDYLEMITLEKLLEIDEIYGNVVDYQDNAFRLRSLASGVDDELFIKSLYAIADAHYRIYNDEMALSYLEVIFEEASEINYSYGLSRYYMLLGDLRASYTNYEEAVKDYENAYKYGQDVDKLLSFCYDCALEIRMARSEGYLGNYEAAYERLLTLLEDIDSKSAYKKRDIYYELGVAAYQSSFFEEAVEYYQLALVNDFLVNKNYEIELYAESIYSDLAFAYIELNENDQAVKYFKLAAEARDSNNTDEIKAQQVSELTSYEVDELENELAFKKKIREAQQKTIEVQRYYLRLGYYLILVLFILVLILIWLYYARGRTQKRLYIESITDHLTKVFNRGRIIEILEENLSQNTCIMMMDVDNFKMINDNFGHVFGDKVLMTLANVISENLREDDYIGRYGGEEFLVVLRNTSLDKAKSVAERIRLSVEALDWDENIKTTISIGLLQCKPSNADDLLMAADSLMYKAKSLGKNQVVN